jgi:hypothetical protein
MLEKQHKNTLCRKRKKKPKPAITAVEISEEINVDEKYEAGKNEKKQYLASNKRETTQINSYPC